MASLIRLNTEKLSRQLLNQMLISSRSISTSQKNRETAVIQPQTVDPAKISTETSTVAKKNWVSYGYDFKDEAADRNASKSSYFFSVTLCLVWGTFVWAYAPDPLLRDWAQREGFLELRRREAAGLEPVSPDYVSIDKIHLPSDEELGDTEIII